LRDVVLSRAKKLFPAKIDNRWRQDPHFGWTYHFGASLAALDLLWLSDSAYRDNGGELARIVAIFSIGHDKI
jgi:hypothetical protein